MHVGKRYSLVEVLMWTRHHIYKLFILGLIPVLLFQLLDWKWVALPGVVVGILGTVTAFIIGFRNSQTYNRTWEARQIWGGILNTSRSWAIMSRDFLKDKEASRRLVNRHIAWLTALRYSMREVRSWETMERAHNREFQQKVYSVPEYETTLETELANYLDKDELQFILTTRNKSAQILSLQGKDITALSDDDKLEMFRFLKLQDMLEKFYDSQGKTERIKNFPYPRQFATVNKILVEIFVVLLPFCMLNEFDKLNQHVSGIMNGHMIWFVIPFSMLISWTFSALDQVGESTENPFEGSANDVPISQISRTIEIDMKEILGEPNLPEALRPKNNIIL